MKWIKFTYVRIKQVIYGRQIYLQTYIFVSFFAWYIRANIDSKNSECVPSAQGSPKKKKTNILYCLDTAFFSLTSVHIISDILLFLVTTKMKMIWKIFIQLYWKNWIVKLSNEIAKLVKIKSFENENKQSHISEWLVIVKNELQRSKKTYYEKYKGIWMIFL